MVQITPVNINDGDPVTADTLRTIIGNVTKIALGDTGSGVVAVSNQTVGGGGTQQPARIAKDTIADVYTKCVLNKTSAVKQGPVPFNTTFSTPPSVTANLMFTSNSPANYKYNVVIASVSTTDFYFYAIPCGATSAATVKLAWSASGTLSTTL